MSVFRRGKRGDREGEAGSAVDDVSLGAAEPLTDRDRGPWDRDEVAERGRRVDLGALWVPGRDGMQLRMEVE